MHAFEDHRGEVQLRLEAATREALYAEAARALAALTAERLVGEPGPPERVEVEARDADALLVAWLDELIYRSEINRCVYPDVRVLAVTDTALCAELRGRAVGALRTAVKAATFHRVHVRCAGGRWTGRVVLDV